MGSGWGGFGWGVGQVGCGRRGGAGSKGGHALSDLGDRLLVLESLHSVHVFIRLQKDALRLYTIGLRRVQLVLENQGHLRVQQGVRIVEVWVRRQERGSVSLRANPGGMAQQHTGPQLQLICILVVLHGSCHTGHLRPSLAALALAEERGGGGARARGAMVWGAKNGTNGFGHAQIDR